MKPWPYSPKKLLQAALLRRSKTPSTIENPAEQLTVRRKTLTAIKLHWWRGPEGFNFGDELSAVMVSAISGRPVERAPLPQAHMLAIGSILQAAARTRQLAKRRAPLHVWGSGVITPLSFPTIDCLEVSAVRGPLTRNVLRLRHDIPLGDPGLLSDRLVARPTEKRWAWGLVPHHTQVESEFTRRLLENTPRSILIDVRESDPLATISKIAACERIASTSLHGLIVADAFHIPNLWIAPPQRNQGVKWKFTDYFLSVGRSLFQPAGVPETHNLNDLAEAERAEYFAQVEVLKNQIASAFPNL